MKKKNKLLKNSNLNTTFSLQSFLKRLVIINSNSRVRSFTSLQSTALPSPPSPLFSTISCANISAASYFCTNSLYLQGNDHMYRLDESPKLAFVLFLSTVVPHNKTQQNKNPKPNKQSSTPQKFLFFLPSPASCPIPMVSTQALRYQDSQASSLAS